jgi:hypothetical protein
MITWLKSAGFGDMLARMTVGRLLGLNSGDWSIMLGGFALIGMVILLL